MGKEVSFTNLMIVVLFFLFSCTAAELPKQDDLKENTAPNIILIMADDLGFETLRCNGGESYSTPNLDLLAEQGVRFTRAYATPLCTPSRVQIMTGQYNFRNYQRFGYLDPAEKTFANYLKDAGYQTAVAGKWQLEGDSLAPHAFGFDHYCLWQLNRGDFWYRYKNPKIIKDRVRLTEEETQGQYGPHLFTDYILDFIAEQDKAPFFVYYPMALVHDPFQPTPDHENYDDFPIEGLNDTTYFRNMMGQMDQQVGRIYHHLESLNLLENTIIIFTGDNGTDRKVISNFNGKKIKGNKGYTTDAGTHVPMIVHAPGKVKAGSEYPHLVDFTDVLPTLLQMANIQMDSINTDGFSFWDNLIEEEKAPPRNNIFCSYSPRWSTFPEHIYVQDIAYKLYADGRFYHYISDLEERAPLAIKNLNPIQLEHYIALEEAISKYLPEANVFLKRL